MYTNTDTGGTALLLLLLLYTELNAILCQYKVVTRPKYKGPFILNALTKIPCERGGHPTQDTRERSKHQNRRKR